MAKHSGRRVSGNAPTSSVQLPILCEVCGLPVGLRGFSSTRRTAHGYAHMQCIADRTFRQLLALHARRRAAAAQPELPGMPAEAVPAEAALAS